MEMKIIQDTKNEVLNRRELVAEIEEKTIPSRDEVRAKLAALAEVNEKTLIIQKIDSSFGNPKVTIRAHAYTDEESMKTTEKEYFLKRNFPVAEKKDDKKEASAPAVEAVKEKAKEEVAPVEKPKAEEAPAEPVKEEPKTETAPVKEKKEEAPAEPAKEEPKIALVEEKKEETPVEDKKEEPKTQAPKEKEPKAKEPKKEGEQ